MIIISGIAQSQTENHYTVDVISAYFICYAIYSLSRKVYFSHLRPLFLNQRAFQELVMKP